MTLPAATVDDELKSEKESETVEVLPVTSISSSKDGRAGLLGIDQTLASLTQTAAIPFTAGKRVPTTLKEVYAYYTFFAGATGLSPLNFAATQFQNLLYQAAWDPTISPPTPGNCTSNCVIKWGGRLTPAASVVLDVSGIAFGIQAVFFIICGSFGDYGSGGRYIVTGATLVSFALGFAWLGVETPNRWMAALMLNLFGLVAYNLVWSMFVAAHTGLARDLPNVMESEEEVLAGKKSIVDHEYLDMLERNRIGNISETVCTVAGLITLLPAIGILKRLTSSGTTAANTKAYSVMCGYLTGVWVVLSIPWLLWEQKRPRQALPTGASYLTIGFVNLKQAVKEARILKQVWIYLAAYFLVGDCMNTAFTLEAVLQNQVIAFSSVTFNYVMILNFAAQSIGYYTCYSLIKWLKWSTKTVLIIICGFSVFINLWGMIGVWTPKLGFHNVWEIWAFQVLSGLMMSPWYQMSFIMIGELVPKTKVYLWFGIFGVLGRTASFVGPFVTSAIINRTGGNENMGFTFLFATAILGTLIMTQVDVHKAHVEAKAYLDAEAKGLYSDHVIVKETIVA